MRRVAYQPGGTGQIIFIIETPQIHFHWMLAGQEASTKGFFLSEVCCHGCAEALILKHTYKNGEVCKLFKEISASFNNRHKPCPDRNYKKTCPLLRDLVTTINLT